MQATFTPLSSFLGMEVRGVNLPEQWNATLCRRVKSALAAHHIVAIRDQEHLAPPAFIALARAFGELEPFFISAYSHPKYPEIYILSNVRRQGVPIGRDGAGFHWHTDNSFNATPTALTLLHACEVPAEGGDTLFVNMHVAYDNLPEATQQRLAGKYAIHRYQKKEFMFTGDRWVNETAKQRIAALKALRDEEARQKPQSPSAQKHNTVPDRLQPVVRKHPVSGRKALYLNEEMMVGIAGEPAAKSQLFLRQLCRDASPAELVLRYKWRKGDIVIWDNASVMHTATYTDPALPRTLHRLTIQGSPLIAG